MKGRYEENRLLKIRERNRNKRAFDKQGKDLHIGAKGKTCVVAQSHPAPQKSSTGNSNDYYVNALIGGN